MARKRARTSTGSDTVPVPTAKGGVEEAAAVDVDENAEKSVVHAVNGGGAAALGEQDEKEEEAVGARDSTDEEGDEGEVMVSWVRLCDCCLSSWYGALKKLQASCNSKQATPVTAAPFAPGLEQQKKSVYVTGQHTTARWHRSHLSRSRRRRPSQAAC